MKATLVFLLVFVTTSALAQDYPSRLTESDFIDPQQELQRLGSIDGVWEGHLTIVEDPIGANRQFPDGYPIRVAVEGEQVGIWFVEEGGRLDALPGEAWLVFSSEESALLNYVAGSDAFTETWAISLSKTGPDEMDVHILRTVHNFAVRVDSPWRVFAVYASSSFERVK